MTLCFSNLTDEQFVELAKEWKESKYGQTKDSVMLAVRRYYSKEKNIARFSRGDVTENDLSEINDLFSRIQQWGGATGKRNERFWANADKAVYVRCMVAASTVESIDLIPALCKEMIKNTRGLGISFATKHLKFASDFAVVFDARVSRESNLPLSVNGYRQFLNACDQKRGELAHHEVSLTLQEVEEAYFQSTQL